MWFKRSKQAKQPAPQSPDPVMLGKKWRQVQLLNEAGNVEAATALCQEILEDANNHVGALMLLGEVAASRGELDKAIAFYSGVISTDPKTSIAYYKRANCLRERAQWDSALLDYDKAIERDPTFANAYCNRGVVLAQLGRFDSALKSYDYAVELNPTDALAWFNRGAVLRELKKPEDALASYDRAIAISPDYVECCYNRGLLLMELDRWDAALANFDLVIALSPGFAEAHFHRANTSVHLRRLEDALYSFERAISLRPDYADACQNRANILFSMKRFPEALAGFDRLIELMPGSVDAFIGRGLCLQNLRQFKTAIDSYDAAFRLDDSHRFLLGLRIHARMQVCDWTNQPSDLNRLATGLADKRPLCAPHALLSLIDSPPLHRLAAEAWVREECPENGVLGAILRRPPDGKIRIGYYSPDFRDHPVALLTAELFETHDRSKFELVAFAFGPTTSDPVRARLERAFDRFIDASELSDREVTLTSRRLGVDIAVDLGGFTEGSRTNVFAMRAAPIQVNYLGYPGTMGAGFMDYLISDSVVIPCSLRDRYTEKIAYISAGYLPNDSTRAIAENPYTREEAGLPAKAFVFCCFNNVYKIVPEVFETWMSILKRTDGSVLWISRNNPIAEKNLRHQASKSGVDPKRLVFADRLLSLPQHLARHQLADLFLDTFPYNAHATAIDALWACLPLITRAGESFASRVAMSLLIAIDLPELVTTTAQQYEDLAVLLSTDGKQMRNLRRKLAQNRSAASLFDTVSYTRDLERVYRRMHERSLAGLPAEHLPPQE